MATGENINPIEIQKLKSNQDRNKFIADRKNSFISVCNKILDFGYDARDRNEIKRFLTTEELDQILDFNKEIELIRKKLQQDAPLEDMDIVRLILSMQYVKTDLEHIAEDYIQAANTLKSYIEILS